MRINKSTIGTVLVLAAFAVLVGLGTWQLERRAEKHALIAHIEARLAAPPVPLPARIEDADAFDYRRVRVTGRFLHDKEMHLLGRVRGGVAGVEVVTPLLRADGAAVLVNRGWVPPALADPAARPAGQVTGPVAVTGIARVPSVPGPFAPGNDPARGLWFSPDVPAMARAAGLEGAVPVIVEADESPVPGGFPKGGGTRVALPDNHLQYALTWYGVAVALVAVVLAARRRRPRLNPRP